MIRRGGKSSRAMVLKGGAARKRTTDKEGERGKLLLEHQRSQTAAPEVWEKRWNRTIQDRRANRELKMHNIGVERWRGKSRMPLH